MSRPARAVASAPSPFAGKTLGRCKIERPLGKGATATVYRATYLPLHRAVAVKILRSDAASAPEARARFLEEAKSLAKLDHPNVVKVFDVVEDGGYLLIIMDFVDGGSLREMIEEYGAVDPEAAIGYARQIAEALSHVHGQRLLHRDVKPANIVVNGEGKAVLVDFGNAEVVGEAADRKGTAHYVAPEVFQGKRQDERTDTYSLGATLFHLLAGEPPHDGETVKEILAAHAEGKLRAPSQVNPEGGIPKELDALVKRAMAPARGYRFLAGDLVAALDEVLPIVRDEPRKPRARRGPPRARVAATAGPSPATLAILLGAGVLVLGGLAYALKGRGEEKPAPKEKPKPASGGVADPAGPGDGGSAGDGIPDAGIDKRASSREARLAAADKAFQEANAFALAHPEQPKEVAKRFGAVASEYGETGSGVQAKEAAKIWGEKALGDSERSARDAAIAEERRKEQELVAAAIQRAQEASSRMRFDEALGVLREVEPPASQKDEWARRRERLNNLIGFAESLGAELEGNAVAAYKVGPNIGKAAEQITGADADGLTLTGTGGTRKVPWTQAKPAEVLVLCRQVMRNSPDRRVTLAAYCWETGMKEEAKREMDNALLKDRTGTVPATLEQLFGPEEKR